MIDERLWKCNTLRDENDEWWDEEKNGWWRWCSMIMIWCRSFHIAFRVHETTMTLDVNGGLKYISWARQCISNQLFFNGNFSLWWTALQYEARRGVRRIRWEKRPRFICARSLALWHHKFVDPSWHIQIFSDLGRIRGPWLHWNRIPLFEG